MPKTPARPAVSQPKSSGQKPITSKPATPIPTTPLSPDEAKRMAAVLTALLKD